VEKLVIAGHGLYAVTLLLENNVYTCEQDAAWLDGHLVLHRFSGWNGQGGDALSLQSLGLSSVMLGLKVKDIYEFTMGLITHYGWQLANGAPVLENLGEIGKIHCQQGALYVYDRAILAADASTKTDCVLLRCGQAAAKLGEASVRPSNN